MERKSAHEPDFEPDVITLLDFVSKWIRKRLFERITLGGWPTRLVWCVVFAYITGPY